MSIFKQHRQAIETARTELDTLTAQIEALKLKRTDYAARAEAAQADISAAEISRKNDLKLFTIDKVDEKTISASVLKIADLEIKARNFNDILKSIDTAVNELVVDQKAAEVRLGRATGEAWIVLFAAEFEKTAPTLVKLFALHRFATLASYGAAATANDQTFFDTLRGIPGIFNHANVSATGTEIFTTSIGTEPLDRFWKAGR